MNNDNNFWFWLGAMANFAQLESYQILLNDFDNHDLMNFLRHQDKLLDTIIEQNQIIINQNEEILRYLKGEK